MFVVVVRNTNTIFFNDYWTKLYIINKMLANGKLPCRVVISTLRVNDFCPKKTMYYKYDSTQ
jgi:hypothetical protein